MSKIEFIPVRVKHMPARPSEANRRVQYTNIVFIKKEEK